MSHTTSRAFAKGRLSVLLLSIIAAVLYCTWPLGIILNPEVGRHQLASQLRDTGQPFNWFFIDTDVLTGIILAIVGVLQLTTRRRSRLMAVTILCYTAFGALVALAALIPLGCDPQTTSCGPLIHRPLVIAHGIASIISVLLLLASLILVTYILLKRHGLVTKVIFGALLVAWGVFGIGSLVDMHLHFSGNLLQFYFISICSLSVIATTAAIEYGGRRL